MQPQSNNNPSPADWFEYQTPLPLDLESIAPRAIDDEMMAHTNYFSRQSYCLSALPLFGHQLRALIEQDKRAELAKYDSFLIRDGALGTLNFFNWAKDNTKWLKSKKLLISKTLEHLCPRMPGLELQSYQFVQHKKPRYVEKENTRRCLWANICLMPALHSIKQIEQELYSVREFCKQRDIQEVFITLNTLNHFFVFKPQYYDFFELSLRVAKVFDFKVHPISLGTGLSLPTFSNYYLYQNANPLILSDDYLLHHVAQMDGRIMGISEIDFDLTHHKSELLEISPFHSFQTAPIKTTGVQFQQFNTYFQQLLEKKESMQRYSQKKWDQMFNFFILKMLVPTLEF